MNGYADALSVEEEGRLVLLPFLKFSAFDNRYVVTDKGPLARRLQESVGDALCNINSELLRSVEFKIEAENKSGNLFLESWSNRNLENVDDHAMYGSNPGWFLKLVADYLWYYFVLSDELFIIKLFELKRWAFRHDNGGRARIFAFAERLQGKYVQKNDTWGWCVPIDTLYAELPRGAIVKRHPKQILRDEEWPGFTLEAGNDYSSETVNP